MKSLSSETKRRRALLRLSQPIYRPPSSLQRHRFQNLVPLQQMRPLRALVLRKPPARKAMASRARAKARSAGRPNNPVQSLSAHGVPAMRTRQERRVI